MAPCRQTRCWAGCLAPPKPSGRISPSPTTQTRPAGCLSPPDPGADTSQIIPTQHPPPPPTFHPQPTKTNYTTLHNHHLNLSLPSLPTTTITHHPPQPLTTKPDQQKIGGQARSLPPWTYCLSLVLYLYTVHCTL